MHGGVCANARPAADRGQRLAVDLAELDTTFEPLREKL